MNIVTFAQQMNQLAEENPNREVIVASDEEGNSFSSVEDYSIYLIEKDYDGGQLESIFSREDLVDEGDYEDHEIDAAFKEAVIIWP